MDIRLLQPEERAEAGIISLIAFHSRTDDLEARKKQWTESAPVEDWGAFDGDGRLAAHVVNNAMVCRFDGHAVKNGGIGAVSTLPEYRQSGAVRQIFASLLPAARANGEVLSTLYPFSHAFYRKFGYETVSTGNIYRLSPTLLSKEKHDGWVRQWQPGEPVSDFTRIYAAFAARYNLSLLRDDEATQKEHVHGLFYQDRLFAYLLGDGTGPTAYVVFQDEMRDGAPWLAVREAAWISPAAFRSVLGFLARFSADYTLLELPLPSDINFKQLAQDPYRVELFPKCDYMVRAVNAEKLLALLQKPKDAVFTVAVCGDNEIPENNGCWEVCGERVTRTEAAPDLTVSVNALAQLAVGAISLDAAECRADVTVHANRELLRGIFVCKPLYIGDHF